MADRDWDSAFLVKSSPLRELDRRLLIELLDEVCEQFGEDLPWRIADKVIEAYRILGSKPQ